MLDELTRGKNLGIAQQRELWRSLRGIEKKPLPYLLALASAMVGVSFVVSAFLLKGLAGNTARQGALLQEMFDIALFHLPWRATVAAVWPARSWAPAAVRDCR